MKCIYTYNATKAVYMKCNFIMRSVLDIFYEYNVLFKEHKRLEQNEENMRKLCTE